MTSFILTCLFLLPVVVVTAQDYESEFIGFSKPDGLKKIIFTEDCFGCIPAKKNDTACICTFDSSGKIIRSERFIQKKIYSLKDYYYNPDNTLKTTKDYGHWDYGTANDMHVIPTWDSSYVNIIENYYYDTGKITRHVVYRTNKALAYDTKYLYDAKKNLIKEIMVEHISNYAWQKDSVTYKKEYKMNKAITGCRFYENDSLKGTETITKNAKGQVLKSELKGKKGKQVKKSTYTYNAKGQLVSVDINSTGLNEYGHTIGFGIGSHRHVYTYDNNGLLEKKDEYYEGKLFTSIYITYHVKK